MLVLVSFGLVLLATILLIVGLFNDTLGLIYLSIAASVIAAIVLFLAFRMARPKAEKGREAPEPIDPEGADQTAAQPAVEAPDDADVDADVAVETDTRVAEDASTDSDSPIGVAAPAAAVAASATTSDDDWMDDEEWDDEVVDFPIADYDDLTVAEIMPLLPQLYSDELDLVIERERGGRNRSRIIGRLEELKVSGTEADDVDDLDAPGTPDTTDMPAAATVAAGAPAVAGVDSADDGDDDFFPIADYDDLTVGQIMPLLGQLEMDELSDVRAREVSGAGRKTLLAEIDRRAAGDDKPVAKTAPVRKAAKRATKKVAKKATRKATKKAATPRFPIANYDELTVADIRPRLSDLSNRQLELVRDREAAGAARKTILKEIDSRLS